MIGIYDGGGVNVCDDGVGKIVCVDFGVVGGKFIGCC